MKLSIKKKIGEEYMDITVESPNVFDCLFEIGKLSFGGVDHCEVCSSKKLSLGSHTAQDNDYAYVKCLKCGATVNWGQRKKGGVVYLKTQPKEESRTGENGKRMYYDWKTFEKGE